MTSAAPVPSSDASSSIFKFLITTDNHLGFQERDSRRGDDSFTTFEECLRAARIEHDVDAILLSGDLFHDNKPSLGCLSRTCSLLRKYVMGNKPISFALLSDPGRNFPTHPVPLANFQDPNINVALPIFTIHGNHDDPVGGTSSIDVLSTCGLVNYFGQTSSLEDIVVEPVLLKKGSTYVALYGLGNVRDERLHRCFRMRKLQFVHPKPVNGCRWFKILLFHQNRGVRGGSSSKSGIYESMLEGHGLDLVIWGNEHEQQMVPTPSGGFDIVQPGSTILTSLSDHECNPKKYGILEVRNSSYRVTPFLLRSVRPVVRRSVELWRENPTGRTLDAVEDFLRAIVDDMIKEARELVSRIPEDLLAFHPNIKLPLMRLSVDFTDPESTNFPQPNINRFGQQYMDDIVNPSELLRPIKPKIEMRKVSSATDTGDGGPVVPVPYFSTADIRTKVAEVFNANARDACSLLSEPEVSAAVYAFAEKGERDAIDERISKLLNQCQKHVWVKMLRGDSEAMLKPEGIYNEVVRHKQEVNRRYVESTRAGDDITADLDRVNNAGRGAETTSPIPLEEISLGSAPALSTPKLTSLETESNRACKRPRDKLFDDDDGEGDALPDSGIDSELGESFAAIGDRTNLSRMNMGDPQYLLRELATCGNGGKRAREGLCATSGAGYDGVSTPKDSSTAATATSRRRGGASTTTTKGSRGQKARRAPGGGSKWPGTTTPTLQLTRDPVSEDISVSEITLTNSNAAGVVERLFEWASQSDYS
ncbi:putative endo/exonuclease Mre11 [Trypanosoma vivax]|nr:putative endo/exonuclease Mre11 [Trypanosoma vivax]